MRSTGRMTIKLGMAFKAFEKVVPRNDPVAGVVTSIYACLMNVSLLSSPPSAVFLHLLAHLSQATSIPHATLLNLARSQLVHTI